VDQEGQGDHNPPWWTRSAFYILLMNTPAESYIRYFDALTHRLKQSFPVGDNPWLTFTQAPTTIQLAIHSIPIEVLPDDDEQLFPFIKRSIHNLKAVTIGASRYLNKD